MDHSHSSYEMAYCANYGSYDESGEESYQEEETQLCSSPAIDNNNAPAIPLFVTLDNEQSVYHTEQLLGKGSFGQIYLGVNHVTRQQVAMKFEAVSGQQRGVSLGNEAKILLQLQGSLGVPKYIDFGRVGAYDVLMIEVLGESLHQLLKRCGGKFSLKTVLMLGDQIVTRLELIHGRDVIHRDLKPENILLGQHPKNDLLYLIDFGLSKIYRDCRTLEHTPFITGKTGVVGTVKFASINNHNGDETSRRDDMEALAYILIHFFLGKLPWQGLGNRENQRTQNDMIRECKVNTSVETLCKDCPSVLSKYLTYCHGLRFDEAPDYSYVRKLFRQALERQHLPFDFKYDWVVSCPIATAPVTPELVQADELTQSGSGDQYF